MFYAIQAQENRFGGLHGIQEKGIFECDTLDEAEAIAADMCYDVVERYERYIIADEGDEDVEDYILEYLENDGYDYYICALDKITDDEVRNRFSEIMQIFENENREEFEKFTTEELWF